MSVPEVRQDQVDIEIDPLPERTPTEIIELADTAYTDFDDVTHVENRSATFLGTDTTLRSFTATAQVDGSPVDVAIHVAKTRHEGDVVTAVAIQPENASDPTTMVALIDAIDH